ncbi:MAG: hypothetical protein ACQEQO_10700, partial [Thermodesulfobacteriota bacterium]
MDFFEVTGGFRLVEPPARREGCCLFVTYQWGNPHCPDLSGQCGGLPARRASRSERAKLPQGYVAEKTNPRASELKK